jgi:o-succinylbenzoate synthase
MLQSRYIRYPLHFHRPAGTSRGVLQVKPCWFLELHDENGARGLGEVAFIPGLGMHDAEATERELEELCREINSGSLEINRRSLEINHGEREARPSLTGHPGIRFALETAIRDLSTGGARILYPSAFTGGTAGIPTNGLVWMGNRNYLEEQIRTLIRKGFRVLKMKLGAGGFDEELDLLGWIREEFGKADLEIRLDANGAWSPTEAATRLDQLAPFGIHSIEQPIAAGQHEEMALLCGASPIPIALDEDLIGLDDPGERRELLSRVRPGYLILKPGLLGGVREAEDWIGAAGEQGTGWWVTSALESNIGLNAIAQWAFSLGTSLLQGAKNPLHKGSKNPLHQGLGTGTLYSNNIPSPLRMEGDSLWHRTGISWELQSIQF